MNTPTITVLLEPHTEEWACLPLPLSCSLSPRASQRMTSAKPSGPGSERAASKLGYERDFWIPFSWFLSSVFIGRKHSGLKMWCEFRLKKNPGISHTVLQLITNIDTHTHTFATNNSKMNDKSKKVVTNEKEPVGVWVGDRGDSTGQGRRDTLGFRQPFRPRILVSEHSPSPLWGPINK